MDDEQAQASIKGEEQDEGEYWLGHRGSEEESSCTVSNQSIPAPEHLSLSPDDDTPRPRRPAVDVRLLLFIGLFCIFLCQATVNQAAAKAAELTASREKMREALLQRESEVMGLQKEVSAMEMKMDEKEETKENVPKVAVTRRTALKEINSMHYHLQKSSRQADALKKQVQEESKRRVLEKYGKGMNLVEIELDFPDSKNGPNKFVIVMAPVHFMPHSVETFLDMVSAGLWDGCSFILNAMQVVKAAPLPSDGTSASAKVKAFTDLGLDSVAFREYSQHYPHKKYTVGFAADGSPHFYVNTEDNSLTHSGDPCFGKVIEGFDTIDRLAASPTRGGIWFEKRIGIKHAKMLKNDTEE